MPQQIALLDLQFGPDTDPKLRRLAEEFRRLQLAVNSLISEDSQSSTASIATVALAAGEWRATVVPGSPATFVVRYNDGGTIRTGSITLS